MVICSVFDSKAKAYRAPIAFATRGVAIRQWQQVVNDENEFNTWPMDFTFFELGEFDEQSGELKVHEKIENLGLAADYIQEKVNNG